MNFKRIVYDFKHIFLNCFVNKIPCWNLRKCIYILYGTKIGKLSRIGINTIIHNPDKLQIGERTIINDNCYLDARGGIIIGKDVSISSKTCIFTTTHDVNSSIFQYKEYECKIDDNVWIGANSTLIAPVILKQKTIIGAASVYKGVSEENGIYIGNPAKIIAKRNLDISYKIDFKPYFR